MSRNQLIIAAALLVALMAGWYFLSNKQTYQSTLAPTTETTKETSPSATVQKNIVTITSNGFTPQVVTIKAGESVDWVNNNSTSHEVNSAVHPTHQVYPPLNNVGLLKPGEQKTLSFPTAGTYKYHDHLNPSLTGVVTVE